MFGRGSNGVSSGLKIACTLPQLTLPPPHPLAIVRLRIEKQGLRQGSLCWQNHWHTVCKNVAVWGLMLGVHRVE